MCATSKASGGMMGVTRSVCVRTERQTSTGVVTGKYHLRQRWCDKECVCVCVCVRTERQTSTDVVTGK